MTSPFFRRLRAGSRGFLLVAAFVPSFAAAQGSGPAPAAPLPASALERAAVAPRPLRFATAVDTARAQLRALMAAEGIPGLSIAVLVDGAIVWSEGLGLADLENRQPVTTSTRFRIGSVSKPVTAALLGVLAEQGKLDLDAPVHRYVPDLPPYRWPITTRQVAGHLAGIRHYGDESEILSSRRYATVREALAMFERDSLRHEPGTRYLYSSFGWNLVSAVLEGAAGEAFLPLIRRSVLEPLALNSIVAEHQDSLIDWRARFYSRGSDGRILNATYVDQSNKWAGGGFVSNAEDLVRFAHAHLDGRLLREETVRLLFASQRTSAGTLTNYGLGWRSGRDDTGAWVGHTGSSVGGRALLLFYPEHRAAIAVLANLDQAPLSLPLGAALVAPFVRAASADSGASTGSPR